MKRKPTTSKPPAEARTRKRAAARTTRDIDRENPPLTSAELRALRPVALSKRIRWNLGMSQEAFSEAYHIPIGTLRDWEQYRSEPDAAARTLLLLIEADPKGVVKTLKKVPA